MSLKQECCGAQASFVSERKVCQCSSLHHLRFEASPVSHRNTSLRSTHQVIRSQNRHLLPWLANGRERYTDTIRTVAECLLHQTFEQMKLTPKLERDGAPGPVIEEGVAVSAAWWISSVVTRESREHRAASP